MTRRALAFAGVLALLPSAARAQDEAAAIVEAEAEPALPFQYQFLLLSTARWQIDNGDRTDVQVATWDPTGENFVDLVNTIGGSINYEQFLLATRFDTALYLHQPIPAPTAGPLVRAELAGRYRDQVRLEYIAASYSDRDVQLTLGDYYVTLGRGLVLAVRKVDDVGIDNKLRGGEAKVRIGPMSFHVLAGVLNIKNFEQGTGYTYDDPNDVVAGARVEYRFGKYLKVGAHAAHVQPPTQQSFSAEYLGYGASIELPRPVPWGSLYLEAARVQRDTLDFGVPFKDEGYGFYGSSNLSFGAVTVLIEGKYYENLFDLDPCDHVRTEVGGAFERCKKRQSINRLTIPPTAERAQILLLSNKTVQGGRVRVDYAITPKIVPYLSVGRYHDEILEDTGSDATAVFAGARVRWERGEASGEAGYRAGSPVRSDLHFLADVSQRLFGPYAAELFAYVQNLNEQRADADWWEGRVALSWKSTDGWAVTGAYEFYTRQPDRFDQHYFSIAGQWEFMTGSFLRALYGGERAGLKCSGGVCRFFPGFEGGRLELVLRL